MPRLDGTGPSGKGPKTGRGLGKCAPNNNSKKPNNNLLKRPLRLRGLGLKDKK